MPPPPKQDPPLRLVLTANSLRNTTIAVEDDSFYYEIVTRFWHPTITKIRKLDAEEREIQTIAEIEREPGKEPRVRYGEGEWMDVNKYIEWNQRGVGGTFTGTSGIRYRWKTHRRRLQLVKADSSDKVPVVQYFPFSRHFFVMRMSKHASLEVKQEVVDSLDSIIITYLLAERQRRDAKVRVDVKLG